MGERGIVIGFAEPSLLSRLPVFFLLADRIELSGLRFVLYVTEEKRKFDTVLSSRYYLIKRFWNELGKARKVFGMKLTFLVIEVKT